VLAARDREALAVVAGHIRDTGGDATSAPADVSDVEDVERLFALLRRWAQSRSGVRGRRAGGGTVRRDHAGELDENARVNLTGSFLCCRARSTAMRPGGEGRIVTIGSLSGVYATEKFPGLAAYNVSKYGRYRAHRGDRGRGQAARQSAPSA